MNDILMTGDKSSPIDHEALLRRCIGRVDLMQRILESFINRVGDDIESLVKAVKLEDESEVTRLAHKLKGAALTVAATEMAVVAEAIETQAPCEPNSKLAALAQQLGQEKDRVLAFMTSDVRTA
jgi:HPt (histidine-containing phosphotransfer) domain-containing protein